MLAVALLPAVPVAAQWDRNNLVELAEEIDKTEAVLWTALPRPPSPFLTRLLNPPPPVESIRGFFKNDEPIVIAGDPGFDAWQVIGRRPDPLDFSLQWLERSGLNNYALPFSDYPKTYGVQLYERHEPRPRGAVFDYLRLTVYEDEEILSVRLMNREKRQSYRRARPRSTNHERTPLSGTESWHNAMLQSQNQCLAVAGFEPGLLIAGYGGRLPASNLVARMIDPDAWHDGWAVLKIGMQVAHLHGEWSGPDTTHLADEGGHSLLKLVSTDCSFAAAVKLKDTGRTWRMIEDILVELEYSGRSDLFRLDERALDQQVGFSIRHDAAPLLGDRFVAAFMDDASSWSILVEVEDGPLAHAYIRQALQRTVGEVTTINGYLPIHSVQSDSSDEWISWSHGENWIATSSTSETLATFLAGALDPRHSLTATLAESDSAWESMALESPLVLYIKPARYTNHPARALTQHVAAGIRRENDKFLFDIRMILPGTDIQVPDESPVSLR